VPHDEQRPPATEHLLAEAWTAVSGDGHPSAPLDLEITGRPGGRLPSRYAVEDAAVATIGAALLAARALHDSRGGDPPAVGVNRGHAAVAVRSERYFRYQGQPAGLGFAPYSRFFETADGWVRTHGNYPWHRQALARALGTNDDVESVMTAMRQHRAVEIEDRVVTAGGIAAAVRSSDEWQAHLQGRAAGTEPLVARTRIGDAPARRRAPGALPASGLRVIDLTRVIAGPVATRFLGALGADVLRLDPPRLPDLVPDTPGDTLLAKRSAFADFGSAEGAAALRRLLDEADVLVCGYRLGSVERYGLDPAALARSHPGLVVVRLDAWGHSGPWAGRRGFDSIVQAACGIAVAESDDGGATPGVLPCQLLDHGTGYLAAAAALEGVWRQATEGGTQVRLLSLARTAGWLTSTISTEPTGPAPASQPDDPATWTVDIGSADAPVLAIAPPGTLDGRPLAWPTPPSRYGAARPEWR
jgi:crotonobetainyl-CoA:carnitine CoA-transferase CaiB-like acyl-CoA transferase